MTIVFKATVIWFVIACLAEVNGVIREHIFAPRMGVNIALPLSGLTLSIIVFAITFCSIDYFKSQQQATYILIGVLWGVMTLAFEFLFGHFVANKSWSLLMQNFNVAKGDLFTLVLVITIISPYIAAKLKGVI